MSPKKNDDDNGERVAGELPNLGPRGQGQAHEEEGGLPVGQGIRDFMEWLADPSTADPLGIRATEEKHDSWVEDRAELFEVAQALVAMNVLNAAEDVLYFIEKPWKWGPERDLWVQAGRPGPDDPAWELVRRRIAHALDD